MRVFWLFVLGFSLLLFLAPPSPAHLGTELAVDKNGQAYFIDTIRDKLWKVDTSGKRTVLADNVHDGQLLTGEMGSVYLLHGEMWKIGENGELEKLDSVIQNTSKTAPDGSIYAVDSAAVVKIAPDGSKSVLKLSVDLKRPVDLILHENGHLFLADFEGRAVYQIDTVGQTVVAAASRWPWAPTGVAAGKEGLYVLERMGDYFDIPPMFPFLADLLGNPRVRLVRSGGKSEALATVAGAKARWSTAAAFFLFIAMIWSWKKRTR